MIAGLRGTVEGRTADALFLAVGGVVFQVFVPASTLAAAPASGQPIALHTHLFLREDNVALYGFASQQELETFRALLAVSGVGPRLALALISALGTERLSHAISEGQTDVLSTVPGVGKRTAGRLVLELKGKLAAPVVESDGAAPGGIARQALATLTGLGYGQGEAQEAWRALAPEDRLDLERAIRACLVYLAERR